MQATVSSAEQQVSSLEAALQKGSQVTLSMTEKVAQTLAASNAQAEALKVSRAAQVVLCKSDNVLTSSLLTRDNPELSAGQQPPVCNAQQAAVC